MAAGNESVGGHCDCHPPAFAIRAVQPPIETVEPGSDASDVLAAAHAALTRQQLGIACGRERKVRIEWSSERGVNELVWQDSLFAPATLSQPEQAEPREISHR